MRVALLGVSGMLGSMAYRLMSQQPSLTVFGTTRSGETRRFFDEPLRKNIVSGVDAENPDALAGTLRDLRPDVVVNCIGVVKQLASAKDPLIAIPVNSVLPHRLARFCDLLGARLIHVSTDCVFSGRRGNYRESDAPDAEDLYGRTKLLGEVDYRNAVTLRTSIIGRELSTRNGLVEWFLSEKGAVKGFSKAIFSGLTTDELTRVMLEFVLDRPALRGTYHVSAEPIDKYRLLNIVKEAYGATTEIVLDEEVTIDRSLDSSRFRDATGYRPPAWPEMIERMRDLELASGS
jgi:dTDP-4-dehydrorhamnose reductase